MNIRTFTLLAIVALVPATNLFAATIISESFSGSGANNLDGKVSDVGGATWEAHADWKQNGTKVTNNSANAWVPFTPVQGKIYRLSLDVNPTLDTSLPNGDDWFALGFSEDDLITSFFHDGTNNPRGWIGNRGNDASPSAFFTITGPGTAGVQLHDPSPDVVGLLNMAVELNTTNLNSANWTVEWFVNGTSIRGPVAFGSTPTINFVGFGALATADGVVDNFLLVDNAVVPEPTSVALWSLLGVAGLVFAWRSRKAKR